MNSETMQDVCARRTSKEENRMRFIRQLAEATAAIIGEKLRLIAPVATNDRILPPFMKVEACNLMGLRRRQFERFCEIMLANPTETPFRAAKQVLTELDGRGGYTRASSLQRYAGKHRRYW